MSSTDENPKADDPVAAKDESADIETGADFLDAATNETNTAKRSAKGVDESDDAASPSKRRRAHDEDEQEVLDLATTLGLKVGDRLEVEWEIVEEGSDESTSPRTRWWGATLLEHDGRTEDSVAIRVLDYDPFPEGGFPERSQEDVIFIGRDVLIDPVTEQELFFRREGDDDESAVCFRRDDIEEVVNSMLMDAMIKNERAWNGLDSAQQARIAEMVALKKEKLVEVLAAHPNGIITSSDMQAILVQTMQES
jgi:hypothetical protein